MEPINLELQRNASLTQEVQLQDTAGGPLDLTGNTLSMKVRSRAGDTGSALATATISVIDAATGLISIYLAGSSLSAVPGAHEIVRLAYDLIVTRATVPIVVMRGTLALLPGVS